jgi:hypothetical protein
MLSRSCSKATPIEFDRVDGSALIDGDDRDRKRWPKDARSAPLHQVGRRAGHALAFGDVAIDNQVAADRLNASPQARLC